MIILESVIIFLLFVFGISVFLGVPFLPTHKPQVEMMMDLAEVGPGKVVVDLGSGAGRLLFAAAKRGAKAIGYELNPFLVLWTKLQISRKGLSGQVTVLWRSLFKADLTIADVAVAFLFPRYMPRLEKKVFAEQKGGAKFVSYVFPFCQHEPKVKKSALYLYEI
jgi:ribosomal protein L11 methylase PrmA